MIVATNVRHIRGRRTLNNTSFLGILRPASKHPCLRGLFFGTVSGILLIVGTILTWIVGFHGLSKAGPVLIGIALILFLISTCQFLQARKKHLLDRQAVEAERGRETVTTMVIDQENGEAAVTVVMDNMATDEVYSNNDCAPPSYVEATDTDINNDSVLLPEAVDEENEEPPSYDEALNTSCMELQHDTPVVAGNTWAVPIPSGPISQTDSCQGDSEDSCSLQTVSNLDREGAESNDLEVVSDMDEPATV